MFNKFPDSYSVVPKTTRAISGEFSRSIVKYVFEVTFSTAVDKFSVGTVCPSNFDTRIKIFFRSGKGRLNNDNHGTKPLLDNNICTGSDTLSTIKDLPVSGNNKIFTVELSSMDDFGKYTVLLVGSNPSTPGKSTVLILFFHDISFRIKISLQNHHQLIPFKK